MVSSDKSVPPLGTEISSTDESTVMEPESKKSLQCVTGKGDK